MVGIRASSLRVAISAIVAGVTVTPYAQGTATPALTESRTPDTLDDEAHGVQHLRYSVVFDGTRLTARGASRNTQAESSFTVAIVYRLRPSMTSQRADLDLAIDLMEAVLAAVLPEVGNWSTFGDGFEVAGINTERGLALLELRFSVLHKLL